MIGGGAEEGEWMERGADLCTFVRSFVRVLEMIG